MITISVCMIVKNEEQVLARCLDGLKRIADEMIIVDTGSTDRTREIARSYTDQIFEFAWIDDFAAARNFSFSKAKMEYIYAADADEVLTEEEIEKFLLLKETLDPSVEIVQMLYTNQLQFNTTYNFDEELRPKLYRRCRNFVWQEPVHEAVRLTPVIYDSEIRVAHCPVSEHAGRDFAVFARTIRQRGDLSDRLTGMYARELLIAGEEKDFLAAIPFFQKKLEEAAEESLLKQCQCVLVRAARLAGDDSLFFKNALKNVALDHPSSEVCFELGEYYFLHKDIYEAMLWYYNAIYETEPELNLLFAGSLPAGRLAECHELLGNQEQAAQYRKQKEEFLRERK